MGLFDGSKEEHTYIVTRLEKEVDYLKAELLRVNTEHSQDRARWDAQRMDLIDTICISRGIPSPFEQAQDAARTAADPIEQPMQQPTGHLSRQQLAMKKQAESMERRNARILEQQANRNRLAKQAATQPIPPTTEAPTT